MARTPSLICTMHRPNHEERRTTCVGVSTLLLSDWMRDWTRLTPWCACVKVNRSFMLLPPEMVLEAGMAASMDSRMPHLESIIK
jgi:hypothetical protein